MRTISSYSKTHILGGKMLVRRARSNYSSSSRSQHQNYIALHQLRNDNDMYVFSFSNSLKHQNIRNCGYKLRIQFRDSSSLLLYNLHSRVYFLMSASRTSSETRAAKKCTAVVYEVEGTEAMYETELLMKRGRKVRRMISISFIRITSDAIQPSPVRQALSRPSISLRPGLVAV